MAPRPLPTPQYDGPSPIPYDSAARYLWGDDEAGFVPDWYYLSNDSLHYMTYSLPEGRGFTHSEDYPTKYGADEVMIVLAGKFALANPETGEVVRLEERDAVVFREDTWHHGFNVGTGEVVVLEYLSPPPLQGSIDEPSDDPVRLPESEWQYLPAAAEHSFPMAGTDPVADPTLYRVGADETIGTIDGRENPTFVSLYADTPHLRVGAMDLNPGQTTDAHAHEGDEGVYVGSGEAFIHLPEAGDEHWFEISADDGFYIPAGTPHEYHNASESETRLYFGISPNP